MKEIAIQDLQLNPFAVFGKDWMALTAGNEQNGYNTMTIAWGHLGSIWERSNHRNCLPTAICYVRPSRYTKEFADSAGLCGYCGDRCRSRSFHLCRIRLHRPAV